MDYFKIKVHHGGRFVTSPRVKYVGGLEELCENCNIDTWRYFECLDVVEKLGYEGNEGLGFKVPDMCME